MSLRDRIGKRRQPAFWFPFICIVAPYFRVTVGTKDSNHDTRSVGNVDLTDISAILARDWCRQRDNNVLASPKISLLEWKGSHILQRFNAHSRVTKGTLSLGSEQNDRSKNQARTRRISNQTKITTTNIRQITLEAKKMENPTVAMSLGKLHRDMVARKDRCSPDRHCLCELRQLPVAACLGHRSVQLR